MSALTYNVETNQLQSTAMHAFDQYADKVMVALMTMNRRHCSGIDDHPHGDGDGDGDGDG